LLIPGLLLRCWLPAAAAAAAAAAVLLLLQTTKPNQVRWVNELVDASNNPLPHIVAHPGPLLCGCLLLLLLLLCCCCRRPSQFRCSGSTNLWTQVTTTCPTSLLTSWTRHCIGELQQHNRYNQFFSPNQTLETYAAEA
jgi:hypothetical protein